MSKAFTRESDDAPDDSDSLPLRPSLPPGAKNYLTTQGAQRLREELDQLIQVERPNIASGADPIETRRRLRVIDQRIQLLSESLESAVIVDPAAQKYDQVRFGAAVEVRDGRGAVVSYRIVGIDESDPDRGWISWLSPIAKALAGARVGQRVRLRLPAGEEVLEVLRISSE